MNERSKIFPSIVNLKTFSQELRYEKKGEEKQINKWTDERGIDINILYTLQG